MMLMRFIVFAILLSTVCLQATSAENALLQRNRIISYQLVETLPHDASVYTQGLALHHGLLLESGGLYGRSALYLRKLAQTEVLRQYRLPHAFFAEGLAVCKNEIHLLTWREQLAWVFTLDLQLKRRPSYSGEGWGLTCVGEQLVRSDGSHRLSFLDPLTYRTTRVLEVRDQGAAITHLNELEYARGWVLANVWHRNEIALIDPGSGAVDAWLDLTSLRAALPPDAARDPQDVLNGIAYDATRDLLYVTGKRWPYLFAIRPQWPRPRFENKNKP